MWKLKLAEGGENLVSENNFIGRQHWEFDPNAGTPQERAEVERLRQEFTKNRFFIRQSSDLLMRMQLKKENNFQTTLGKVEVGDEENVTAGVMITTMRRALTFYSSIQAHDGHWAGDFGGPLFLVQPLIRVVSFPSWRAPRNSRRFHSEVDGPFHGGTSSTWPHFSDGACAALTPVVTYPFGLFSHATSHTFHRIAEATFVLDGSVSVGAVFSWEFVPRCSSGLRISQFSAQIQYLRSL
ncbi:hypothetical protein AHAS_Ahas02G0127500 [Arachis hypogaea]